MSHTSGVRHYREGEWLEISRSPCITPAEALAPFREDIPSARGSYLYSSFGYVLLSQVVAAAAGEEFENLMTDRIFRPAGMTGASLWAPGLRRPPHGHVRARLSFPSASPIDNSCKFGAGALIGTADDLARFGVAVSTGGLVPVATWRDMTQEVGEGYGFGFGVSRLPDGSRAAIHSGSAAGGTSVLAIDVESGLSVAIVANAEGPSLVGQARQLLMLARRSPDFTGR